MINLQAAEPVEIEKKMREAMFFVLICVALAALAACGGDDQCQACQLLPPGCTTPRSLDVRQGWNFVGTVGQRGTQAGRENWPVGPWQNFPEGGAIAWCPSAGQAAAFNVQAARPSGRDWAIQGSCVAFTVDSSMFEGNTPESQGCTVRCSPDGWPDFLCL